MFVFILMVVFTLDITVLRAGTVLLELFSRLRITETLNPKSATVMTNMGPFMTRKGVVGNIIRS